MDTLALWLAWLALFAAVVDSAITMVVLFANRGAPGVELHAWIWEPPKVWATIGVGFALLAIVMRF
jgi:hypothetical protein